MSETLTGILESIQYRSDEGDWIVGTLSANGRRLKVKGVVVGAEPGLTYSMTVEPDSDRFGEFYRIHDYAGQHPVSTEGIKAFLETLPGIGSMSAGRLVDAFGDKAIETLRDRPLEAAAAVPRLTTRNAGTAAEALHNRDEAIEGELQLRSVLSGLGPTVVKKAREKWKNRATDIIKDNPYRLTELPMVGFMQADQVALKLGVERDSEERIKAGCWHLAQEARNNGSTVFGFRAVVGGAMNLLGLNDQGKIEAFLNDSEDWYTWAGSDSCQLAIDHKREMAIAQFCHGRIGKKKKLWVHDKVWQEQHDDLKWPEELAADQIDAFLDAHYHDQLFVITGAPGTGKTFLLRAILDSLSGKTLLMAPTGKAAQRMSEMTGRRATTIHRALMARPLGNGKFEFVHDEFNPLPADTIVIDEFSMVDTELAYNLFRAIDGTTRVLIIGDHYQLPSVGPGAVLRDFLACNLLPHAELKQIKRQDPGAIVTTCHRLKDGQPPAHDEMDRSDLWVVQANGNDHTRHLIGELVHERLPEWCRKQGIEGDPRRAIQVLTPRRQSHELCTKELNQMLRMGYVQKGIVQDSPYRFGQGDRVIQTKNDYDIGVFNGDIGTVTGIKKDGRAVFYIVQWDAGGSAEIPAKKNSLDFASALTIHKSQGSEWPVIVLPVNQSFGPFFDRPLLYTALSRGAKLVVVVGDFGSMCKVASRVGSQARRTGLQEKLAAFEGEKVAT